MHVCTALPSKTSPIGSAALGTVRAPHPNPAPTAPSASGCCLGCRSPRLIRAAHTRVELVCVDELHNLNLATRSGAEVSDQLKYFAERLPATFVYAGIDLEVQGLFAGVRGRQIAGRFTVIPAAPFAYGTGAQRGQWRALIAALESLLRLHRHRAGRLVRLDEYLYRRSGGMIGSLSQLVRGAAILAIEDGSEQISKQLLDSVAVDYAAVCVFIVRRPP